MSNLSATLWSIGMPLLLLGAGALLVPFLLIPRDARSHKRVGLGIALSACAMVVLGAIVYLLFDDRDLATGLELNGLGGMIGLAIAGSIKSAMLWVPILALYWFYAAQRVERLIGEDKAREGLG